MSFTESQLIGQWEVRNPVRYTETLSLRADHTFTQVYSGAQQLAPIETQGQWRLEQRGSGCVYIHLNGMRNFHFTTMEAANRGNRDPDGIPLEFWEPCENTRITMPDRATLIVGHEPGVSRGIILLFPRKNAEVTDTIMELVKIKTSIPTEP